MHRALLLALALIAVDTVPAVAAGPTGPDIAMNSTTTGNQTTPDVATLPGGGFVGAWVSDNQNAGADGVYHRRFDGSGAPLTGELLVSQNASNLQERPSVSSAPDGRFVVAWSTYFLGGSGNEVRARAYNADGSPAGDEFAVNTTSAGSQKSPDVAMAPDGSFVVVWAAYTGSPGGGTVTGRRFGPGGTTPGPERLLGSAQTDDSDPRVAIETGGAFVVAWTDYAANSGDVRVRRFTAADDPVFDARTAHDVTTGTQDYPDVAITADGFVVAWSTADVFARRFGPGGAPLASQVSVNSVTAGSQDVPFLAVAPDGTITAVWTSVDDAVGRRMDASLAPIGGEFLLPQVGGGGEIPTAVASFADAFVGAWIGSDGSNSGVFARRHPFDSAAPAPVPPAPAPAPAPTPLAAPAPGPAPTPPAAAVKPATPAFSKVVLLPSTRKCVSRRRFRIRLRHPRGTRIASAVVKLNRKRVATRKGRRVSAPIDLRGLPKGRFKVEITVRLADKRVVRGTRNYRTCTPKRR